MSNPTASLGGGYLDGITFVCGDCGAQGRAVDAISCLLSTFGARVTATSAPVDGPFDAPFFEQLAGPVLCGACVDAGKPADNVTRSPEASS